MVGRESYSLMDLTLCLSERSRKGQTYSGALICLLFLIRGGDLLILYLLSFIYCVYYTPRQLTFLNRGWVLYRISSILANSNLSITNYDLILSVHQLQYSSSQKYRAFSLMSKKIKIKIYNSTEH